MKFKDQKINEAGKYTFKYKDNNKISAWSIYFNIGIKEATLEKT